MKNRMMLAGVFFMLCAHAHTASAAQITINPPLVDLELQNRDSATQEISITNTSEAKIFVYATVNEIAIDEGGAIKEFISPSMDNRESSVTSWVEITRGRIELEPGETEAVSLTVKTHPNAQPGIYHAFIGFVPETKRPDAEAKAMAGDADGVILKVALQDKSSASLSIQSFLIDRFILKNSQHSAALEIQNNGTKIAAPEGEIIFYNSRSEEIGSVAINPQSVSIPPSESRILSIPIPFKNELGRIKANVVVRYGDEKQHSIFDTTQFYMVPFHLVALLGTFILLFSFFVTYLIRRAFYDELHEDDEGNEVPLRVRNDREHTTFEHDIDLKKN